METQPQTQPQPQIGRQTQIPAAALSTLPFAEALESVSASGPGSSSTATSSRRESEGQPDGGRDGSIRSDISAWQSALQSLPPAFSNAEVPVHPLARALVGQPTLRPVEWNQFRQQGGFVPRTAHDYSSLMIYLCGQVNPNPCRNCRLRNGPFARCVVAPPSVLAVSTLRHACANCTYQNQYKKCSNAPISAEELARSELARSVVRNKHPIRRPTIPRLPKANIRTQQRLENDQPRQPKQQSLSVPQPQAKLLLSNMTSFDEKLRRAREWSPRSRKRMTAEALQWQAAIATVEAEGPDSIPNLSVSRGAHGEGIGTHPRPPPSPFTPSQPIPTVSAAFATPDLAGSTQQEARLCNDDNVEYAHEPMDEDESESGSEQEDSYASTSGVGPDHSGPMIKASR